MIERLDIDYKVERECGRCVETTSVNTNYTEI